MTRTATSGPRVSSSLVITAGTAVFLVFAFLAAVRGEISILYAAVALLTLLITYTFKKSTGICVALIYLLLLGDIRRVVGWIFGFPINDPLIAVGFVFAVVIVLPMMFRPKLTGLTEKLSFALMAVMALQMLNPAQGGLLVGLIGAIYTFPPMLWFWIGRTLGGERLMWRVIFRVVVPIAILAALLGYYQVLVGSPVWQTAWVEHVKNTYNALRVGTALRAFGFSNSSSEYNNLLLIASVSCIAAVIAGRTVYLLPLAFLVPGILIGSQRSTAMHLLLAVVFAFTFKNRGRGSLTLRFVFVLVAIIGVGAVALTRLEKFTAATGSNTTNLNQQLSHQIGGLAHPFDTKYSTAVGHSQQVWSGLLSAYRYPIGFGLGSTSLAASRNSGVGTQAVISEFEISDTFISLGLPGGLLYLALIVSILRDAVRYSKEGSKLLGLTVVTLLFSLVGFWLFTGEYGNGPVLWLLIGCFRKSQDLRRTTTEHAAPVAALQPALN